MTGRPIPGAHVTLYSADPAIVTVSGLTVTASEAGTSGRPIYLWMEGDVPNFFFPARVTVVVCPSTEVGNGFASQDLLSSRSCASVFWGYEYNANLYRVALTRGQTLTVTMKEHYITPQLDPWLELANRETGVIVATNDNDPTGVLGAGSRIVYTAPETGMYVIEASSARRGQDGLYLLQISID